MVWHMLLKTRLLVYKPMICLPGEDETLFQCFRLRPPAEEVVYYCSLLPGSSYSNRGSIHQHCAPQRPQWLE